jgi:ATP-dependent DNA ligase
MLGYPPKPTSILPKSLEPDEWIAEPKWRGWRIVVHDSKCYTRKGNLLPIRFESKHKPGFDYQLDGEIVAAEGEQTEHKVRGAIKSGDYIIQFFDIYIPSESNMILIDRLNVLTDEFKFDVWKFPMWGLDRIDHLLETMKRAGFEGLVFKKKTNVYQISTICEIIDPEWVKIK